MPSFRKVIGLQTHTEALRHLLKKDVPGEQPPEKVLQGIEALAIGRPEKDRRNLLIFDLISAAEQGVAAAGDPRT